MKDDLEAAKQYARLDQAAIVKLVEQQRDLHRQLELLAEAILLQSGKAADHVSGFRHRPATCTTCAVIEEAAQ